MASVRKNKRQHHIGLHQSIRDELDAPQHLTSAGEELVKQLASKQTETRTTLQEQLQKRQNFVPGGSLDSLRCSGLVEKNDIRIQDPSTSATVSDVGDSQEATGVSRHDLEQNLAVKPQSTYAQLYKFALNNASNSQKSTQLIDQLPNHPINNLQSIEKEFIEALSNPGKNQKKFKRRIGEVKSDGEKSRKPRKRRKRKIEVPENVMSKVFVEGSDSRIIASEDSESFKAARSTSNACIESNSNSEVIAVESGLYCSEGSKSKRTLLNTDNSDICAEISELSENINSEVCSEGSEPGSSRDLVERIETFPSRSPDIESSESGRNAENSRSLSVEKSEMPRSRPSLWGVKDMRTFCKPTVKTCEPRKLYTIKDGKIVQVESNPG